MKVGAVEQMKQCENLVLGPLSFRLI